MRSSVSPLRTRLKALGLIAIGIAVGVLLRYALVHPAADRVFTCASSRQFLVEFRATPPSTRGLIGLPIYHRGDITLEADGDAIGVLATNRQPLRRFLCEGNHTMRITFSDDRLEKQGQQLNHTVDIAVSRPSVFQVTEHGPAAFPTCVAQPYCAATIDLELSQDDPDEKLAAIPE